MLSTTTRHFIDRTVTYVAILVFCLSILRFLPAPMIAILTIDGIITPARLALLTLIHSFVVTCFVEPTQRKFYAWLAGLEASLNRLSNPHPNRSLDNLLADVGFGITRGLLSLPVISYFRASLSLALTYKTSLISVYIAIFSALVSFLELALLMSSGIGPWHEAYWDGTIPRTFKSNTSFSLNAITSFGFLCVLNSTHAIPFTVLTACVLSLVTLSDAFDYWKIPQVLIDDKGSALSRILAKSIARQASWNDSIIQTIDPLLYRGPREYLPKENIWVAQRAC